MAKMNKKAALKTAAFFGVLALVVVGFIFIPVITWTIIGLVMGSMYLVYLMSDDDSRRR